MREERTAGGGPAEGTAPAAASVRGNIYFPAFNLLPFLSYLSMEQVYTTPAGMPPAGGPPPKNWLVESILVTIFCCLPFGIVAIVNAANVNSRLSVGDRAGAQEASVNAGKWVKYGLIGGLLQVAVPLFLVFVLGIGRALLGGAD